MSQTRRSDLRANSDVTYTDDAGKFKKAFQTVGRPEVTKDDIHEEYMRHPPNVSALGFQLSPFAYQCAVIRVRISQQSL